ncbi:MAG: Hsp20/alpha crystallin family protein [Candidatus Thermoplasmatota archaeon]|nr:Hsp20/alpha crystallin family protein [Candidatus Thermoplasmatota archaeon]
MTDEEKEQMGVLLKGLRLGGLLSGLGEFLSKAAELAEKGEGVEGGKTFEGKGYKGAYSYRVATIKKEAPRRVGVGIRPGVRYEPPKYKPLHVEKTKTVEPEAEAKEPLVDVFDKNDHVLVVVSLPNIKEENLEFNIEDNVLKITAKTPEGKVEKDITIPEDSKVSKIEGVSFRHGILEIKLRKKKKKRGEHEKKS